MATLQRLPTRLASSVAQCQRIVNQSRYLSVSRRLYAKENKSPADQKETTFKGQLYNSVYERIQREKADEARFAVHRDAQQSMRGGGQWILPFGALPS
jgi:D-lactate dehydrogenase (cytochrome)